VINLLVRKFGHQKLKTKEDKFLRILLTEIIEKLLNNQWRFLD